MEMSKSHYTGIILGVVLLALAFVLSGTKVFFLFVGLGFLVALAPFVFSIMHENKVSSEKEEVRQEILANIEKSLNIRSTYYFRVVQKTFLPNIIRAIEEMGHEIGYHYEDLTLARGNKKKAVRLFEKNLNILREISLN